MKNAYKLHVVETGRGNPPVILLHGIVSTHRYWLDVVDLLKDKRKLVLPDLLGFGNSPRPRKGLYNLQQYTDCLEYTFSHYKFSQPPVLVGHSMGALIALRWSVLHPEKFSGLVLCSPVFIEEPRFYQQLASIALEGRYLASRFLAKIVTAFMGLAGLVPSKVATQLVRKWPKHVIEDVTRHRYRVFRKILKNKHFMEHVLTDLRQVELPLHVLIGEHDPTSYHALKEVEAACEANQTCHIQVLDTGHQLPLQAPEAVAEAILNISKV